MVGFPLLLIPIAVYNLVVWLMPGVSLNDTLFTLKLLSGEGWKVNLGDILLAVGVLLLLLEVIKGARPGSKYLTDHLLSLIVFGGSAAEFLLWQKFGNSTFFLLSLMAMVDFFGGIALHARRRTAPAPVPRRPSADAQRPVPTPEPQIVEPKPVAPATAAPATPSAASVAESVLLDHPQPRVVQPDSATSEPSASEPSPRIASPELQPGEESAASSETPPR
jgi:hypothetical protein